MRTFFLLIFFIGCSQSPNHLVTTSPSRRIISLAPSLTEELYLLGVGNEIVGVTTFCNYPPEAKTKEKIGTYLEPNLEKIVALKPNIVLATESQKKETIKKLKNLGIDTSVFREGNSFKEITQQFVQLAKIVGKEKEAKEIVELSKNKIKKLITSNKKYSPVHPVRDLLPLEVSTSNGASKLLDSNGVKVFLQLGSEPLITCGQNTFLNEIVELAGGKNIAANLGEGVNHSGSHQGYFRMNREKVIQENPDVILIVSMGGTTEKELKTWLKFENLKAVKKKRIYVIDADRICRPTLTCFIEGLETVSGLLRQKGE